MKNLLLWTFLRKKPFIDRRKVLRKIIICDKKNVVHLLGKSTVIYVDMTIVYIVKCLYALVILRIKYPDRIQIIGSRCVWEILQLMVGIIQNNCHNSVQRASSWLHLMGSLLTLQYRHHQQNRFDKKWNETSVATLRNKISIHNTWSQ